MSLFFFFKQKTAYEMSISDWSSDVCSSDPGDSDLKDCVVDHGAYERTQFAELAGAIKPHIAVVLSIVPETRCHTLTESWATGIPVFGIDRGAVGDRIREHGGGWLVDGDASPAEIHAGLVALRGIPDERKARIEIGRAHV